ncbi:hypothetical protein AB0878_17325 [Amycolatopsis sp. NPDC047767]|uniref:hypothetical protein n=1 Tax=Amycolatopsis sp. NPDC047767 TaxID=3156765 RepID=UPI0034544B7D
MLGSEQNLPRLCLPPTVVAAHLRSCAEELAGSLRTDGETATLRELTEVVTQLVAGQHALAHALAALAGRVDVRNGALAAAPSVDVEVVTEVLQAAACAVGCSAEALAEAEPSFECVSESAGPDTRL